MWYLFAVLAFFAEISALLYAFGPEWFGGWRLLPAALGVSLGAAYVSKRESNRFLVVALFMVAVALLLLDRPNVRLWFRSLFWLCALLFVVFAVTGDISEYPVSQHLGLDAVNKPRLSKPLWLAVVVSAVGAMVFVVMLGMGIYGDADVLMIPLYVAYFAGLVALAIYHSAFPETSNAVLVSTMTAHMVQAMLMFISEPAAEPAAIALILAVYYGAVLVFIAASVCARASTGDVKTVDSLEFEFL